MAAGIHFIGGWVVLSAGMDAVEKIKSTCSLRESNSGRAARSSITILTELSAYTILIGRPQGKILHGIPRRRIDSNIRLDLIEMGRKDIDFFKWLRRSSNSFLL
jgi:hypothetical protein